MKIEICCVLSVKITPRSSYEVNFESKSQPYSKHFNLIVCCVLSVKITILKANHNNANAVNTQSRLCSIRKNNNFESKSQPINEEDFKFDCCVLSVKITPRSSYEVNFESKSQHFCLRNVFT